MIFVCVGSRNYPFDRLFKKLDELCEEGIIKEEIFAQIGTSTYKPKNFKYKDFISQEEFLEKVKEANIVISHGASGSIMKALNEGKKVIAVTRLEKYGEHINDHQIQNNEAFASNKYVLAVYEMDELKDALQKIYNGTDDLVPWENKDSMSIVKCIDSFIQTWQKKSLHNTKRNKRKNLKRCYFELLQMYRKNKIIKSSKESLKKAYVQDNKMTKKQVKEIKEFYKPYRKVNTNFHKFYYNSTGKFYENYLPDDLYYCDIDMYYNNWTEAQTADNKCYYYWMFPNVRQPELFASRINNFYYDKNMKLVSKEQIVENMKKEDELFVKYAVEMAGEKGVHYIENGNNNIVEQFLNIVDNSNEDIVIQKPIHQHQILASINKSSVNTIRVISLLRNNEVKIYSCILRMGVGNSKVDNASSGGITCGIDKNGYLKKFAYYVNGERYNQHPTSGLKFLGIKIPKFEEILQIVKENHPLIPHFRLVSWDFAVDENENVVMIEVNLKYGELDFHQLNNGPLFGEDTKSILNEVYGK